jgi:16S rRNA (guanine(966)-N(2))-methyltransferase RsmD
LRIISGKFKGRRLSPPANLPVRPTTDRAKEALFNILMTFDFENAVILDLFAGTGSISYEFLSRGAGNVTAIEQNHKCVDFITAVAGELDLQGFSVKQANVFKFVQMTPTDYDLVFADPPYNLDELNSLPGLVFDNHLLKQEGIFILEHDANTDFSGDKRLADHRKYGKVHFSIFKNS